MKTLIFDIETTGLSPTAKNAKLHVFCGAFIDSDEVVEIYDPKKAMEMLNSVDYIIGHYVTGFDIPYLETISGIKLSPKVKVYDTKIMAAALFPDVPDIEGAKSKHSLEAWGKRLGELKGEFAKSTDWKVCTSEMIDYCHQDVKVTQKLFTYLWDKYPQLDKDCDAIIHQQSIRGVGFDTNKAVDLLATLHEDKKKVEKELSQYFPKEEVSDNFNPGSGKQLAERLISKYGWVPEKLTPTGKPKTDISVLSSLPYDECKLLMKLASIKKFENTLSSGKEGWMKHVRNGRIHGRINVLGAATGRMSHYAPNLAQVPSKDQEYGSKCRELFIPTKGMVMVGADAASLEFRCLAHYMAPYDNNRLVEIVTKTDIHQSNADILGCDRNIAKHFIYAFMYGAQPRKLSEVLNCSLADAKALKKKFEDELPGFKEFNKSLTNACKRGYLIALDGRHISIPLVLNSWTQRLEPSHVKLNYLLQSAGAILMKRALLVANESLNMQFVLNVHDEIQIESEVGEAAQRGKILVNAIIRAGEFYNLRCPMDAEYHIGENWSETH